MPYDGSGNFTRTFPAGGWQGDAAANIKIKADRHDQHDADLASGLSNVICKDGQTSITADIPFNSKKITGLANPVSAQDAATKAYVDTFPNGPTQTLTSTDAGASIGPTLILDRNSASPAASDNVGGIVFRGRDSTNASTDYAAIFGNVLDPLNTSEDGRIYFQTMVAGTATNRMVLDPTGLNMSLGQGTLTFIQIQTKAASGAITLHADTRVFCVEVQAGGGGGGGQNSAGASMGSSGSGGGGGGYGKKWIIRTAAMVPTCTIGAGGTVTAAAAGGTGGATTYSDGVSAAISTQGGAGGAGVTATNVVMWSGGLGGTAITNCDFAKPGDNGGFSLTMLHSTTSVVVAQGGMGGSSYLGAGGLGFAIASAGTVGGSGSPGIGYGAGGGGGAGCGASAGARGGGLGVQGCVIVTEYR